MIEELRLRFLYFSKMAADVLSCSEVKRERSNRSIRLDNSQQIEQSIILNEQYYTRCRNPLSPLSAQTASSLHCCMCAYRALVSATRLPSKARNSRSGESITTVLVFYSYVQYCKSKLVFYVKRFECSILIYRDFSYLKTMRSV